MLGLTLIAIFNSLYLTFLKFTSTTQCIIGESCHSVINSSYGEFLTMPISYIGFIFFTVILYLIYQLKQQEKPSYFLITILLFLGSIASVGLLVIQLLILKTFCFFCTLSAVIVFILFGMSIYNFVQSRQSPSLNLIIGNITQLSHLSTIVIVLLLFHFIPYAISTQYDIKVSPKKSAISSIKTFSLAELDQLSGVEYLKLQAQLYDLRKQTFINYLAREDAASLNLNLNQYFKTFVEKDIDFFDEELRLKIKKANGNQNQLNTLLSKEIDVHKMVLTSRFENIKLDVLKKYNGQLNIERNYKIDVKQNQLYSISVGEPSAPIHVVVFSDFLCSHCAKTHLQLEPLFKKFPEKFFIEYRHFPHFNQLSRDLAVMSICIDKQGQFEEFAHNVYKSQKDVKEDTLDKYIPAENLNMNQFQSCLKSEDTLRIIDQDIIEMKRLNINYTPAIFVNGYLGSIHMIRGELNSILRQ